MKTLGIILFAGLLAVSPAFANTDHQALSKEIQAGPVRKPLLAKMIELLQAKAEQDMKFEPSDEDLLKRVAEMQFDAESVTVLVGELSRLPRGVPAGWASVTLLERAADAVQDPKALPSLASFAEKLAPRYRYMPAPNVKASSRELPEEYPAGASIAALMKSLEASQKAKIEAELLVNQVAMNNAVVRDLDLVTARLLLKSNQRGGEAKVARLIVDWERNRVSVYADLLEVVREEAKSLDAAAASQMYRSLAGYANGIRLKKAEYFRPWDIVLAQQKPPEFQKDKNVFPYLDFAKTINALAPVAKQPLLPEPSRKDLEAEHKKRFGK